MTEEEKVFAGGVAVITGAGAGIGMGIARRCGQIGMTVVVTDIDIERARKVAGEIVAAGGKAEALQVDVSRPEALDALAQDVFDRHGAVRLLVNNAGIETMGLTWEIPAARWEKTLDINIHGIVHGVRAFVPHMLRVGSEAWIGNLASIGSFGIMPTQTAYIMSKHAIQSFSECLYLEMEMVKAPINVCSIIPGMLKTKHCRLAAVMDPVGIEQIAAEFNVPKAYATEAELLADPEVHAVYIASPVCCHARQIRMAAEAGVSVATSEKTMRPPGASTRRISA